MTKNEILGFVKANAAVIAAEIKSRHKGFQTYISASGKLAVRHVDDWSCGEFVFGGYQQLIYRMPTLAHKVTPELVIAQTKHDLFDVGKGYLSPIEEILQEAYYSETEKR